MKTIIPLSLPLNSRPYIFYISVSLCLFYKSKQHKRGVTLSEWLFHTILLSIQQRSRLCLNFIGEGGRVNYIKQEGFVYYTLYDLQRDGS